MTSPNRETVVFCVLAAVAVISPVLVIEAVATTTKRKHKRKHHEKQRRPLWRALPLPLGQDGIHQTTYTQPQCLLFSRLPPELREMIYLQVLKFPDPIQVQTQGKYGLLMRAIDRGEIPAFHNPCPEQRAELLRRSREARILGILTSCRRVYSEAIGILYEKNTLIFKDPYTLNRTLLRTCIGHDWPRSVRDVQVTVRAAPAYELVYPSVLSNWKRCCDVLAGIGGLRTLRVKMGGGDSIANLLPFFEPMGLLKGVPDVEVHVANSIPLHGIEDSGLFPDGLPFKLVRYECKWEEF